MRRVNVKHQAFFFIESTLIQLYQFVFVHFIPSQFFSYALWRRKKIMIYSEKKSTLFFLIQISYDRLPHFIPTHSKVFFSFEHYFSFWLLLARPVAILFHIFDCFVSYLTSLKINETHVFLFCFACCLCLQCAPRQSSYLASHTKTSSSQLDSFLLCKQFFSRLYF